MKKFSILTIVLLFHMILFAQDDDDQSGFKKENLFTGGSISVSFFNGQTLLGANPIFGYKLNDFVDAGVAFNIVYTGQRDYYQYNDKLRQTTYGPGVFARVYPVKFLFIQGQFEHNFSTLKYIPASVGAGYQADKRTVDANSLLIGGGLAQGRERGAVSFFYISLLFDVLKNINSPYVNVSYDPNNPNRQRVDMAPIIRAGVNIGLFQNRYRD